MRLRAGFGFDLQCRVVVPCNVEAARDAHNCSGTIRLALLARGFVLSRIPLFGQLRTVHVERNACEVTLRWREHAETRFFWHSGSPIAGQIDQRASLWGQRRSAGRTGQGSLGLPPRAYDGEDQRDDGLLNSHGGYSIKRDSLCTPA